MIYWLTSMTDCLCTFDEQREFDVTSPNTGWPFFLIMKTACQFVQPSCHLMFSSSVRIILPCLPNFPLTPLVTLCVEWKGLSASISSRLYSQTRVFVVCPGFGLIWNRHRLQVHVLFEMLFSEYPVYNVGHLLGLWWTVVTLSFSLSSDWLDFHHREQGQVLHPPLLRSSSFITFVSYCTILFSMSFACIFSCFFPEQSCHICMRAIKIICYFSWVHFKYFFFIYKHYIDFACC